MFQKLLPSSKTKTEKSSNMPDWVASNYMAHLHYQHYQPHLQYTDPLSPYVLFTLKVATAMYGKMFKQLQDTTWPNSIIQSYSYTVFKTSNLLVNFGYGH